MSYVVYAEDPDWHQKLNTGIQRMFAKVVDDIRDDATLLAPVDTGKLKESIKTEVVDDTLRVVKADVHYAPYVEEGHRVAYRGADGQTHYTGAVVPPQPFLKPSLYRRRDLNL